MKTTAFGVMVILDGKPELLVHTIRSREAGAEVELSNLRFRASRNKTHWFRRVTDARVLPVAITAHGIPVTASLADLPHQTFRFSSALRVTLVNGETVQITREVVVESTDADQARDDVLSIATEMCHDAGSQWFDAPVEEVEVVEAKLTEVG